ncbi:MAG: hypothetical protein SXV54_27750 [Chloroflexota bacterium]|nr:hypothetical protein [Chloroflexota bacterium]
MTETYDHDPTQSFVTWRYEVYLQENRDWLLKDVPRKSNLRPYEAVYHFNLYAYLDKFLRHRGGQVLPEFPTGNDKIDLIIEYADQVYGLEAKSYVDAYEYKKALRQAAQYGQQLGLTEIALAFFVEQIDDANRIKYEVICADEATGVTVRPIFDDGDVTWQKNQGKPQSFGLDIPPSRLEHTGRCELRGKK